MRKFHGDNSEFFCNFENRSGEIKQPLNWRRFFCGFFINSFLANVQFSYHLKTRDFRTFPGSLEIEHCPEMGSKVSTNPACKYILKANVDIIQLMCQTLNRRIMLNRVVNQQIHTFSKWTTEAVETDVQYVQS